MQETQLFPGTDTSAARTPRRGQSRLSGNGAPRLRQPDRAQTLLEPVILDERLPADHPARTIWRVVEQLDLSAFYDGIVARGSKPGRASTEPKLLVALWLFAAVDGVGNGRKLARLCEVHDAY